MPQRPEGGEPPMGTSPATPPTPNAGMEVQGAQAVGLIVDVATEILPKVGAASEIGQLLLDFIKKASKLVQPGAVSPAAKENQLSSMQRQNVQNSQNMALMRKAEAQPPQTQAAA